MTKSPPTLPDPHLDRFESFAVALAQAAGDVILPLFRAAHGLEDKGAVTGRVFDPVTAADKGAERAIRAAIAAAYPDHGVIGEEYGDDRPDVFVGSARGARRLRDGTSSALKTRKCATLATALGATTDPHLFQGAERTAYDALHAAARLIRYGADAYAYAMVAAGAMDFVVERGLKSWDVEAAVPILLGAGGLVTDWTGAPIGRDGGRMLVVGDTALLPELVDHLSAAGD